MNSERVRYGCAPFGRRLYIAVSVVWSLAFMASGNWLGANDLDELPLAPDDASRVQELFPIDPLDSVEARRLETKLRDALEAMREGRIEDGLRLARTVVETRPKSSVAREILGVGLAKSGQIEEALLEFRESYSLDKTRSSAITKIGDVFLYNQDRASAIESFEKAIQINPSDRIAHQRLGTLLESVDVMRAIDHFERGLEGAPADYFGIQIDLGRAYNRVGRHRETVALLEREMPRDWRYPTAHVVLGTAYLRVGRQEDAYDSFSRAMRLEDSESGVGALGLAVTLRAQGNLAASEARLDKISRERPDWAVAHYQFGETLLANGKRAEAIEEFELAANLSPQGAQALGRIGQIYLDEGKVEDAIAWFEKSRNQKNPDWVSVEKLVGLYQLTQQFDASRELLAFAVDSNPGNHYWLYRQGVFRATLTEYDQAIEALNAALEIRPADSASLRALAMAHSRRKDWDEALQVSRRLVQAENEDSGSLAFLASVLDGAGKREEAIRVYRRVLEKDPLNALALNNLSAAVRDPAAMEESLELSSRAVAVSAEASAIQDTHGWNLYLAKRYTEAVETLKQAVELAPDNAKYHYHLGMAAFHAGAEELARSALTKATEGSAEYEGRDEAIETLERLSE